MKAQELKVKSIAELKEILVAKREALRMMRFKVAQRQLKKINEIAETKHDVAQILTFIRAKQV
jgi:ribosomal protein L29